MRYDNDVIYTYASIISDIADCTKYMYSNGKKKEFNKTIDRIHKMNKKFELNKETGYVNLENIFEETYNDEI